MPRDARQSDTLVSCPLQQAKTRDNTTHYSGLSRDADTSTCHALIRDDLSGADRETSAFFPAIIFIRENTSDRIPDGPSEMNSHGET
jgi:hypothetical protein